MIRLLKFWLIVSIGWAGIWLGVSSYENYIKNGDGFLGVTNINALFRYTGWLLGVLMLLSFGLKSKINWLLNLTLSAASFLFFLFLGEVLCLILIRFTIVEVAKPFHSRLFLFEGWNAPKRPFWGDYSREFGSWRLPNDSLEIVPCHGDTLSIRTNSFGMRDKERTLKNTKSQKRVLMLGDSFAEGYIVNASARHSDILEKETQIEHLNFGIKSTSAINYYLTYSHLAKKFEHDVLTVCILPANDFEDYTSETKVDLLKYPIYRPYWEGTFPNVSVKYSLADISQSLATLQNHNKPIRTYYTVDSIYHTLPLKQRIWAEITLNSYLYNCVFGLSAKFVNRKRMPPNSFAKESFEKRWDAFAHSLEQLAKAAKGKEVIFYAVPIVNDLKVYHQSKVDDLSPRIEALCRKYNITYINLLPKFYAAGPQNWDKLYEPCDGHWTPAGERLVAAALLKHPAYLKAIGLTNP
ncbi:SGNH/GDSL hydrolase family protein [Runella slithyformis]|uniref:Lipolytic protein G-D-S-L family n=1 Tax=Runella slithyformis (strain ATCC 29530 / DSM 19594 / LMG 11500 / NCIMB 11436 / LSU 4) TaxID=761193 RepID=A0A7U3ZN53_RUNSL|nr:SGNH/GDSL hydrolase family protein [Runella slithyformis]AEI50153.1 lipolytic protein G-D-S-L family [Runella slithyformis DSM 19594]